MGKKKKAKKKTVATLRHEDASRKNIPTAEYESVMRQEEKSAVQVAYERRNRDLDPQLVWRGKDEQDWSDLVVHAPPLYIQEKVQPKVLIDDLLRRTKQTEKSADPQMDLFADFNGLPEEAKSTEFYQHDANWTNRLILGDSLQVMASLAEREGLRGQFQCIYLDPPYGITFNSNFQWSTTSRTPTDGKAEHITREPEQVKAFRDTWRDGLHSYLTYLRDRLTVCRDLLNDTGSLFLQIGDENVHRARSLMDEVFGSNNFITEIVVKKKGSQKSGTLDPVNDYILWYGRSSKVSGLTKVRAAYEVRDSYEEFEDFPFVELPDGERLRVKELEKRDGARYWGNLAALEAAYPGARLFSPNPLKSGGHRRNQSHPFEYQGKTYPIRSGLSWKHTVVSDDDSVPGMERVGMAERLLPQKTDVRFIRYSPKPSVREVSNWWDGFGGASGQVYVVQTNERVVQRCLLMATDPGDLVLDPTCGSGTTAYVAEQWGRRWVTIDTSRVALALARARIMGAQYPYYLLADSPAGQRKEAELVGHEPSNSATRGDVRQGFVCDRVAQVTSAQIANNAEVEVIWERYLQELEPLRQQLNTLVGESWADWEVPRTPRQDWVDDAKACHQRWLELCDARRREIDTSINANASYEFLADRPFEDKSKVRVAGPLTVESLSPHRSLAVDSDDELIDPERNGTAGGEDMDFVQMVLDNLKTAGVQQAHKEDKIDFTSLAPWPGRLVCAEGHYVEVADSGAENRAGIFIGPEFGTVSKPDLAAAAREAGDAGFDVLIACAFNYDAHSSEFDQLGRLKVLKARMNADLHMADDLKNTGKGNLFVIFGEPDVEILDEEDSKIAVKINGVDVFHPTTGEVRSDGPEGIACWFIDTDYNEESFFVRHAYFLGQTDPYKSLKTTLKAEVDEEAWATLNSDTSRPFPKPESGRIAVKVINHLGDEVMKVFRT